MSAVVAQQIEFDVYAEMTASTFKCTITMKVNMKIKMLVLCKCVLEPCWMEKEMAAGSSPKHITDRERKEKKNVVFFSAVKYCHLIILLYVCVCGRCGMIFGFVYLRDSSHSKLSAPTTASNHISNISTTQRQPIFPYTLHTPLKQFS